jgi:two-component system response regulator AtoC
VEVLSQDFIKTFNKQNLRQIQNISSLAREAMLEYPWPGNIRELRNNIEFAFATGEGPTLELSHLTPELRGESPPLPDEDLSVKDQEKNAIIKSLSAAGGVKGEAARRLGISRSTLWRKIREYGI